MLADRRLFNQGKCITWLVIIALFCHLRDQMSGDEQDQDHEMLNVQPLRGITLSVAQPDSHTQQNVNDAKKPFEEETILHQLSWMAQRLECEPGFFNSANDKFHGRDGFSGEILGEKLRLMKERVALCSNPQIEDRMENEIAFLEISVIIHKMFIQKFLNKNARFVLGPESRERDSLKRKCILRLSVDQELQEMEKLFTHFDDWLDWSEAQKKILQFMM